MYVVASELLAMTRGMRKFVEETDLQLELDRCFNHQITAHLFEFIEICINGMWSCPVARIAW